MSLENDMWWHLLPCAHNVLKTCSNVNFTVDPSISPLEQALQVCANR